MRVDQIGAHLEAYVATLPIITALRLCNRFGTGNDCHVNRLPIELVKLVEEQIVGPEREKALPIWSQEHRCNESRCTLFDHFSETREEIYQRYHDIYGCNDDEDCGVTDHQACGHGRCEGDQCIAWKFEDDLDEEIVDLLRARGDLPYSEHVCHTRRDEWQRKTGNIGRADDGIFGKQLELFKTHFGLFVWVGHFTTFDYGYLGHDLYTCVTTAHLALPVSTLRHEDWCTHNRVTFDMPLEIGPLPTAKSLSRFSRALKILGLQAGQHPSHRVKTVLSPPSNGAAVSGTDDEAVLQPQLTLLMCSTEECGHGN